jgi:hypothetical protein
VNINWPLTTGSPPCQPYEPVWVRIDSDYEGGPIPDTKDIRGIAAMNYLLWHNARDKVYDTAEKIMSRWVYYGVLMFFRGPIHTRFGRSYREAVFAVGGITRMFQICAETIREERVILHPLETLWCLLKRVPIQRTPPAYSEYTLQRLIEPPKKKDSAPLPSTDKDAAVVVEPVNENQIDDEAIRAMEQSILSDHEDEESRPMVSRFRNPTIELGEMDSKYDRPQPIITATPRGDPFDVTIEDEPIDWKGRSIPKTNGRSRSPTDLELLALETYHSKPTGSSQNAAWDPDDGIVGPKNTGKRIAQGPPVPAGAKEDGEDVKATSCWQFVPYVGDRVGPSEDLFCSLENGWTGVALKLGIIIDEVRIDKSAVRINQAIYPEDLNWSYWWKFIGLMTVYITPPGI